MRVLSILFILFATSCATRQSAHQPPAVSIQPQLPSPVNQSLNLDGIQQTLGFDSGLEVLGYGERAFNTCEMGLGFSKSENCRMAFYIQIHFQLLCRQTETAGSTSFKISEQLPLAGRHVKWKLAKNIGSTELDDSGRGQVRLISFKSLREQRLKLSIENDFVTQTAGEVDRILTPHEWCQ